MGIVKERMDKFEASEKATKRIKQALSRGDTAVVMAEAEFLVSWASEMDSYFPENSNQSPSEAKDEIWLQWDDFVGAIQSFDQAARTLIDASKHKILVLSMGRLKRWCARVNHATSNSEKTNLHCTESADGSMY